jgi:hypothetical protein
MGYHPGPYRDPASLPGANVVRPTLHTARKVRFADGQYIHDATGSNEPMSATGQRVVFLVARAEHDLDVGLLGGRAINEQRQRIRSALSILVDGPAPVIANLRIEISEDVAGQLERIISYTSIDGARAESVTLA